MKSSASFPGPCSQIKKRHFPFLNIILTERSAGPFYIRERRASALFCLPLHSSPTSTPWSFHEIHGWNIHRSLRITAVLWTVFFDFMWCWREGREADLFLVASFFLFAWWLLLLISLEADLQNCCDRNRQIRSGGWHGMVWFDMAVQRPLLDSVDDW